MVEDDQLKELSSLTFKEQFMYLRPIPNFGIGNTVELMSNRLIHKHRPSLVYCAMDSCVRTFCILSVIASDTFHLITLQ